MAENEQRPHEPVSSQPSNSLTNSQPPPPTSAGRPTISVPPRTSFEALLNGPGPGFSPGPMTLVSSFFSDSGGGGEEEEDCRSFSQLLAGALASPSAGDADFRLLSPMFSVLDSTGILSPGLGPFGMTHQQVLAHVTAQAAAQMRAKTENESDILSSVSNAEQETRTKAVKEPRSYLSGLAADNSKPNDDGYNWRKYGQKQVKGSEFPRSYYKCTHPSCPVKKKVERSLDGQVTEIIYKGQHCHGLPWSNKKRGKDVGNSNTDTGNHDLASQFQSGDFNRLRDQESSQATKQEQISGTSDSDEVGQGERDEDEPEPKRRHSEPASSHRATTEPRIVVQTTSEVDLLEDGYRWRKYGQKVVKGNPYPRSYYKCTASGCNVRKHVERASTDQKAVITAYEGKHNHDVPAGKNSSHNAANQRPPQGGSATEHRGLDQKKNLKNSSQQPI